MRLIVISGVTGFLGRNLAKHLTSNSYKVIGLVRDITKHNEISQFCDNINFSTYDVNNGIAKLFATNTVDMVIHTATNYGRNDTALNVLQTNECFALELLECAAINGVKAFFNTDTFFNNDNSNYNYLVNYITSKKNFVNWGKAFALEKKIKFINLKLYHLYGFGDDPQKFVASMIRQILNKDAEINLTSGEQKRDFIYIQDAVVAYSYLLEYIGEYMQDEFFIEVGLGSGIATTIKDFILNIKQITGNNITKLNFGAIPVRNGEFTEAVADMRLLKKIGFLPKYGIQAGLTDYIQYIIRDKVKNEIS